MSYPTNSRINEVWDEIVKTNRNIKTVDIVQRVRAHFNYCVDEFDIAYAVSAPNRFK